MLNYSIVKNLCKYKAYLVSIAAFLYALLDKNINGLVFVNKKNSN